jgi:hypothetical protein
MGTGQLMQETIGSLPACQTQLSHFLNVSSSLMVMSVDTTKVEPWQSGEGFD